jgi:predicted RNase H-like HicB family nuclease
MKELRVYQDADDTWVVTCEKIPGYAARGKTRMEAVTRMKKALSLYFPCGDCKGPDKD